MHKSMQRAVAQSMMNVISSAKSILKPSSSFSSTAVGTDINYGSEPGSGLAVTSTQYSKLNSYSI